MPISDYTLSSPDTTPIPRVGLTRLDPISGQAKLMRKTLVHTDNITLYPITVNEKNPGDAGDKLYVDTSAHLPVYPIFSINYASPGATASPTNMTVNAQEFNERARKWVQDQIQDIQIVCGRGQYHMERIDDKFHYVIDPMSQNEPKSYIFYNQSKKKFFVVDTSNASSTTYLAFEHSPDKQIEGQHFIDQLFVNAAIAKYQNQHAAQPPLSISREDLNTLCPADVPITRALNAKTF